MSLRDQLLAIRHEHGTLTPAIVLNEARLTDSPLHHRFEWDNSIAGEAYRRDQAHRLIQSVKVTYSRDANGPKTVRAFLAVDRDDSPNPVYEPITDVIEDPLTLKIVQAAMIREIRALQNRYGHLKEFAALLHEVASETQVAS